MTLEAHQKLLNSLAKAMEHQGITITRLDIDGTPEYFDEKYRKLPVPKERDGYIPDLEGMKGALRHLGEAKIMIKGDENLDAQFRVFANREMNGKEIPFHIAVPKSIKKEAENMTNTKEVLSRSGQITCDYSIIK
jgi:predicted transcriptional regulator